ncbi:MAG: hypothetical protein ACPG7F_01055 [Aggregatilineales bacterium]
MNQVYNTLALIFTILTLAAIGVTGYLFATTDPVLPTTAALPTVAPTFTPITPTITFTPSETSLPPTFTPTPTITATPTATSTETATDTPTATITDTPAPTFTPSITFTPSASPTFTPTWTPTGASATPSPTEIPFAFKLRENPPLIVQNFANSAGCNWQGMGGRVLKFDGTEYSNSQVIIRAFKSNLDTIDRTANIGSNTLYGPGGWEVALETQITNDVYFVRLETVNGTEISPTYQVQFPNDCTQNVAVINFIETRPQP